MGRWTRALLIPCDPWRRMSRTPAPTRPENAVDRCDPERTRGPAWNPSRGVCDPVVGERGGACRGERQRLALDRGPPLRSRGTGPGTSLPPPWNPLRRGCSCGAYGTAATSGPRDHPFSITHLAAHSWREERTGMELGAGGGSIAKEGPPRSCWPTVQVPSAQLFQREAAGGRRRGSP